MQEQLQNNSLRRKRIILMIIVALLMPSGILIKLYGGEILSNQFVDFLYVVFWVMLAALLFPKASPLLLSSIVFIITCLLEFLQLVHNPFLQAIRSTFVGRCLIGTTFSGTDFIYYAAGAVLSYYWLRKVDRALELS